MSRTPSQTLRLNHTPTTTPEDTDHKPATSDMGDAALDLAQETGSSNAGQALRLGTSDVPSSRFSSPTITTARSRTSTGYFLAAAIPLILSRTNGLQRTRCGQVESCGAGHRHGLARQTPSGDPRRCAGPGDQARRARLTSARGVRSVLFDHPSCGGGRREVLFHRVHQ
jgi:hypothetical protein